jgi:hypothetical protein
MGKIPGRRQAAHDRQASYLAPGRRCDNPGQGCPGTSLAPANAAGGFAPHGGEEPGAPARDPLRDPLERRRR